MKPRGIEAFLQRLNKQNTYHEDKLKITVTHPFHPKYGKSYNVIRVSYAAGTISLRCGDSDGEQFLVFAKHTDYGKSSTEINALQSGDLEFKNLLELRELIEHICDV